MEFSPDDPEVVFELICESLKPGMSIRPFSRRLVLGVCETRPALDEFIGNASENWRLDRMSRLDRTILRLATFELLYLEDVPPKVSIDEAVELGKKYGAEDSGSFINGILDNVYNTLLREGRLNRKPQDSGPGA